MRVIKNFFVRHTPRTVRFYHRIRTTLRSFFELPSSLFVDETNIQIPAHNWPVYGLVVTGRFVKREKRFYYEEELIPHFKKMMHRGGIFFDVGASIGYWSYVAVWLGAKQVVAFEPIADLTRTLRQVGERYRLPITIVNHSLGEPKQEVSVHNSQASLRQEGRSLDDFVRATGIVPTVIKIDVDGNEPGVIHGALRVLREHHPDLFLEVRPETRYLVDELRQIGYREKLRLGNDESFIILTA